MKLLARYLGGAVLGATLLAAAILVAIMSFIQFVGELGHVGQHEYGLTQAFAYVVMSVPRRAVELLPMSCLLGSLIGLGNLASHGELTAMRAGGASLPRIVAAVVLIGALLMALSVALGEFVLPDAQRQAQQFRAAALGKGFAAGTRYGFWGRNGNTYINVRQVLPDAVLEDVYLYDFDERRRLLSSIHARTAVYSEGRWVLQNAVMTRMAGERVLRERARTLEWETALDPQVLKIVEVQPGTLPVWTLRNHIRYLETNGQESGAYRIAFWSKVANPLSALAMLLLALPFVFGPLRSVSVGQRILIGVSIGIGFHILNQGFLYMGRVYELGPALTALTPTVAALAIGAHALRRVR